MIRQENGYWRSYSTREEKVNAARKAIATLTPAEYAGFREICKEIATTGRSETAAAVSEFEWDENPMPVRDWLMDKDMLGETGRDMYPTLRDDFCELFADGALALGGYYEAVLTGAIGWGKDYFATTAVVRMLYELLCLKNPQHTLGLAAGEPIHIVPISKTVAAARRVVFGGVCKKLNLSKWFTGKYVETMEEVRFKKKGIYIVGGASQDASALGLNVICAVIDESNFLGEGKVTTGSASGQAEDKATMIYNALARRVKSRYARHGVSGLVMLVSSKRSTEDFTERRIRRAVAENDPGLYVRDYATWHVHPEAFVDSKFYKVLVSPKLGRTRLLEGFEEDAIQAMVDDDPESLVFEFPDDYLSEFRSDTDGATRDFGGIATDFAGRLFISRRQAVDEMVDVTWKQWFTTAEWPTSRVLGINWQDVMDVNVHGDPVPLCCAGAIRHVHIDLSTTHCATGFCMGHIAGSKEVFRRNPDNPAEKIREDAPIIHIDCALRVVAPEGEDIDHAEVRGLVYRLMEKGVPIRSVSMDQYMAPTNLQLFKRRGLRTAEVGERKAKLRLWMTARQALYEGRVISPQCAPLQKELKELELDSGGRKVKHPPKGCFTGDTRVRLLDGRRLSFVELVAEFGEGQSFYVYTIQNGAVSVGTATAPRLTARNAEIVAVTLDNGEVIHCTPDHRFMRRDGSYCEADRLRSGDSLMPLYAKVPKKRRDGMSGYELYLCPKDSKWHFTHRMVGKWKYPDVGYTGNQHGNGLIHHEGGKLNNSPTKLRWCADAAEHALLHREDLLAKRADPEFESKRLAGLQRYNDDPENRAAASKRMRETMGNPETHKKVMAALKPLRAENGRKNIIAYNKSEAHRQKAGEIGQKTIQCAIEANRRREVSIELVVDLRRSGLTNPEIAGQLGCSVSLVERRISAAKRTGLTVPSSPYQRKGKKGNHKVVSVTAAGRADVYDLTVDGTQNFALEAGVFVHNSKDLADAWAGVIYYISENMRSGAPLGPSKGHSEQAMGEGPRWTAGGDVIWGDEDDLPPPPPPTSSGENGQNFPPCII